jgi:hypothetical protein
MYSGKKSALRVEPLKSGKSLVCFRLSCHIKLLVSVGFCASKAKLIMNKRMNAEKLLIFGHFYWGFAKKQKNIFGITLSTCRFIISEGKRRLPV